MIALSSRAICADHKRKMGKSEGRGGVHVFTRPSSVGWHNQCGAVRVPLRLASRMEYSSQYP
jgi:hypothetical protein